MKQLGEFLNTKVAPKELVDEIKVLNICLDLHPNKLAVIMM